MENEYPQHIGACVAESMDSTGGHEREATAWDDVVASIRRQRELAGKHIEGFDRTRMAVCRWSPRPLRHLTLEE